MPTRNPNVIFQANLQPNEKVILTARRHWIVLLRNESIWGTLWLICSFIFLWRVSTNRLDTLNIILFFVGCIFFLGLIYGYLDWRNDMLVVTNERIIFYDSNFLVSVQRNELYNRDIENVKVTTETFIARKLNYGQINVETASRLRNIEFRDVANPNLIRDVVMKQVNPLKNEEKTSRIQDLVRTKVLKQGTLREPPPPPAAFLPDHKTGRGFFNIIPPSPEIRGNSVIWRRHWLFLFVEAANPILLFFIILVAGSLVIQGGLMTGSGAIAIMFLLLAFCFGWLIYEIVDWRNDEYIITPQNIFDIERKPLGQETKRETTWDRIQNVSLDQPNLLARVLKYGNIELSTAGQQENFTFRGVSHPDSVLAVISDYRNQFQQRARDSEFDQTLMLMNHYHTLQQDEVRKIVKQEIQAQQPSSALPPTQKLP